MFVVTKALNHNAVLCSDTTGREHIALGKGIGFGVRAGDALGEERVGQLFRASQGPDIERLTGLISDLPAEDVAVAARCLDVVRAEMGDAIADRLALPFTDHLAFALQRAREGVILPGTLAADVASFYPGETALAYRLLGLVTEVTGVQLGTAEAGPIALHVANAVLAGSTISETVGRATLIGDCVAAAEEKLGPWPSRPDLDWSVQRFATHLRYLLERRLASGPARLDAGPMIRAVSVSCPQALVAADAVMELIESRVGRRLRSDERLYLAVHCTRLHP